MGRIRGFGFTGTSVQTKPGSILQSEEQPSPLTVLPSSHCFVVSPGNSSPLPHTVVHAPGPVGHLGSRRQKGEQPSPVTSLPSSHCSEPSTILSPQVVVVQVVGPLQVSAAPPSAPPSEPPSAAPPSTTNGTVGVVHTQPSGCEAGLLSSVQSEEQPSPSTVLPSSHCSLPATLPSPHWAARHAAMGGHTQPHSTILQSAEQPSPLTVLPSSQASSPSIM